jgi:hypothetical protein
MYHFFSLAKLSIPTRPTWDNFMHVFGGVIFLFRLLDYFFPARHPFRFNHTQPL